MNYWQIAGAIVSIVGTAMMFYGSYIQAQGDKEFQDSVSGFVQRQQAEDAPEVVALALERRDGVDYLSIKNIGRKPASRVMLRYLESSAPKFFMANSLPGAREIPQSTNFLFPLNLFSGLDLLMKTENSDPNYKNELSSTLDKFKAGEIAFIPRFYIEYYHGEKRLVSPNYYLVINAQGSKPSLGKEE